MAHGRARAHHEPMRRLRRDSPWWTVITTLGSLAACLLLYYGVPLGDADREWVQILLFAVGFVGLCYLIRFQVRRQLRAGREPSVRVQSVVGLLSPIIIFFSIAYYLLAINSDAEFVGIETRTDALYFTVVTLGTVGYGDVHPVGQAARVITMVQILFDLAVIGVLVAVATQRLKERAELHHPRRPEGN
ncbi:two pore domain potassium channel family protein [Oerskovia sp. KBS0722]|nr:two pore domain potassium channel family protein [Oerskovia sp. KBS0722]